MTQNGTIELVTFSTLYPNLAQPNHGIFVENRLRHLLDTGKAQSRVVAPVPWFPFSHAAFGSYASYARIGAAETRSGVSIEHPKYVVIPKIGMQLAPQALFRASLPVLRRLQRERDFDVIDAHYFYPDGVAAAWLGSALGKPVTITARGTDINLIPDYPRTRRMILEAASSSAGIIAVSQALKDAMIGIGIPATKVTVLRNGVDLAVFHPGPRDEFRQILGFSGPTLLSVGLLIYRKGHDLVISALPLLPGFHLLVAGEGEERRSLEHLAQKLGVSSRVRFLGGVPHRDLHKIYAAADALVLASSREGWPNVLLEAMACGTPVVASNIWGNPEVVSHPEAGVLMRDRTAEGVAEAVKRLFAAMPDRAATRRYAEQFSWDATSEGQLRLFRDIISAGRASGV